jgi:hypothetical protein
VGVAVVADVSVAVVDVEAVVSVADVDVVDDVSVIDVDVELVSVEAVFSVSFFLQDMKATRSVIARMDSERCFICGCTPFVRRKCMNRSRADRPKSGSRFTNH